jgi:hypothetical protein
MTEAVTTAFLPSKVNSTADGVKYRADPFFLHLSFLIPYTRRETRRDRLLP